MGEFLRRILLEIFFILLIVLKDMVSLRRVRSGLKERCFFVIDFVIRVKSGFLERGDFIGVGNE